MDRSDAECSRQLVEALDTLLDAVAGQAESLKNLEVLVDSRRQSKYTQNDVHSRPAVHSLTIPFVLSR